MQCKDKRASFERKMKQIKVSKYFHFLKGGLEGIEWYFQFGPSDDVTQKLFDVNYLNYCIHLINEESMH